MSLDSKVWTLKTTSSVLSRIVFPKISRVVFVVTRVCNQRCKTCDIWGMPTTSNEMKLEEIEKFCSSNPYILWASISGGEPTTRKDYGDIISTLMGIRDVKLINTATNGQKPDYLEKEISRVLRSTNKPVKLSICVSIEGPEPIHDDITGKKDSYKLAMESFSILQKLSKSDWRLDPRFEYTISRWNQGFLRTTISSLSSRFGLSMSNFSIGVAMDVSNFGREGDRFQIEKYRLKGELESLLTMYSLRDRTNITSFVNYVCLKRMLGEAEAKVVGLDYSVIVGSDWNLYPTTFQLPDYPVGNLRDFGFSLKYLLDSRRSTYVAGGKPLWSPCDSFPALIFKPWRLL